MITTASSTRAAHVRYTRFGCGAILPSVYGASSSCVYRSLRVMSIGECVNTRERVCMCLCLCVAKAWASWSTCTTFLTARDSITLAECKILDPIPTNPQHTRTDTTHPCPPEHDQSAPQTTTHTHTQTHTHMLILPEHMKTALQTLTHTHTPV